MEISLIDVTHRGGGGHLRWQAEFRFAGGLWIWRRDYTQTYFTRHGIIWYTAAGYRVPSALGAIMEHQFVAWRNRRELTE